MSKTFSDIREYIKFLEKKKDLVRVKQEVDPVLEINAIIDRLVRCGGPAVLFENVKGSKMPVFGNAFGTMRRVAWSFGVDDVADIYHQRIAKLMGLMSTENMEHIINMRSHGFKNRANNMFQLMMSPDTLGAMGSLLKSAAALAVEVPREKAPCKEIVLSGDQVDLDAIPLVQLWPEDGGKFITLPLVLTRDLETREQNLSIYRMQKLDKKRLCMHWLPQKHGAIQYQKYEKANRDMPVVVAVGADPALEIAGIFPTVGPLDEWMVAGFLKGSSVKYVTAEDSDIWVPSTSEIVLEGVVKPHERATEGPFGEFNGFYSPPKQTPIFHVNKITMRRDPIWHVATTGRPPSEIHMFTKTIERLGSVMLKDMASKGMSPGGITDFNLTVESGTLYTMIVSINKTKPNQARDIIKMVQAMGMVVPQFAYLTTVIVVDSDVDVRDYSDVLWAYSNTVRPEVDVVITDKELADLEKPSTTPRGRGAKIGIDATRKWLDEGMDREMPGLVKMEEAVDKKVERNWRQYGFK
ncbi:MAG: UbiD family decarboxylase [Actinobacteria bacterium]|nr:UbiD family decarboxylase [Actinomycetota bacterium]